MGPSPFCYIMLFVCVCESIFPEQQRDAPQCGDTHQGIDNAADKGSLPAEYPGHQIELENTDGTPVDSADNHQDQGNNVEHRSIRSFPKDTRIRALHRNLGTFLHMG